MTITRTMELAAAYADCRAIAKREAKNFYYGFRALPRAKSDAMCAIYAFMRRADDLADDESVPVPDRRWQLTIWLDSFHTGNHVALQDWPVFLAVRDVQSNFGVSDKLLDELVAGTAMDLSETPPEGVISMEQDGRRFDVYTTVEALERYCYLVASVVGLVTIRIFGYQQEITETQAIAMGKAFQLTNILRDVKEDAERGRIYLPLELLQANGSSVGEVLQATATGSLGPALMSTLQQLAERAGEYYRVESTLIADLNRDSRGAMRTLVAIYHALLQRIVRARFQVFAARVRVPAWQKLAILARGLLTRSGA